eukprot:maker-scaffold373_size192110-snap-gene-0.47 protein:Tk03510 transcript:maker-scaffold373_size192110-snap-gene-0.47-mRNA-1 annotation:"PREDICTED: hypothetical protein LOC100648931"
MATAVPPTDTPTQTEVLSAEDQERTLKLRLQGEAGEKGTEDEDKRVKWSQETVDNEHMGRKKSKCCCIYVKPKKFVPGEPSLGLLGGYGSDSSSSDSEAEAKASEQALPPQEQVKLTNPFSTNRFTPTLPKPSFLQESKDYSAQASSNRAVSENSVFSNPFRNKEDQKMAVLEQHVAMTTKQEELKSIDGRKICWNFRKGRCRFGHKCTFAHDSDVKTASVIKEPTAVENVASTASAQAPAIVRAPLTDYDEGAVITGQDSQGMSKKKKRPGLSDGLVPGKKAMKFYKKVYNNDNE